MVWPNNRTVPTDWAKRKRAVHQRDAGTCHVCRHQGADQVDHLINVARGGSHELTNLALIHGGACTTCGQRCHIEKTARESVAGRTSRRRAPEKHPGLI